MMLPHQLTIRNQIMRVIYLCILFYGASAGRQYTHPVVVKPISETEPNKNPLKRLNLAPLRKIDPRNIDLRKIDPRNIDLRNIDLSKIYSNINASIPATTLCLAVASMSINTILFQSMKKITHIITGRKKIKLEINIPVNNSVNSSVNSSEPNTKRDGPLTEQEVLECQREWSNAIEIISAAYLDGGDFVDTAIKTAGDLYGYEHHEVLFKPTKATNHPFRATDQEAMSYFVGAENFVNSDKFKGEDAGFAINGGNGWKKVVFDNHKISIDGKTALAMGSYYFTCATTGEVTIADFTFGYKRCIDGKPRIFLHHSSVPYRTSHKPTEPKPPIDPHPSQLSTHIHIHTTNGDFKESEQDDNSEPVNHLSYLVPHLVR